MYRINRKSTPSLARADWSAFHFKIIVPKPLIVEHKLDRRITFQTKQFSTGQLKFTASLQLAPHPRLPLTQK